MKAVNKALLLLVSLLLHLLIIGSLFFFFLKFANWYFYKIPLLGVDFYNTVTHVSFLKRDFQLPLNGFIDMWYTGFPLYDDVLLFHFYAILPLTYFFPIIDAVKYYTLGSTFLFGVFSYFLFFRLNRNHLISGALSLLALYSVGFFGSLTWGGSIPYYATQTYLPSVMLLLVLYLQTCQRRWFCLAALFAGWSFLGHPALAGTFVVPVSILLLLLGQYKNKVTILERIFRTFLFLFIAVIVSYRVTGKLISFALTLLSLFGDVSKKVTSFVTPSTGSTNDTNNINLITQYYEKLGWRWISDTNSGLFILLGIFAVIALVIFIFRKDKKNILEITPFLIFAIYAVIQVLAISYGIYFLNQGWYRQFWHFAFIFATLAAVIIGNALKVFSSKRPFLNFIIHGSLGVLVFGLAITLYQITYHDTISRIDRDSSPSSAYPEALSIYLKDKEKTELIPKLLPSWLKGTDKQYRVYEADAQVNVWWSSAFEIPLVRGYIDPPVGTNLMGNLFLLDQALGGEGLVKNFKYDENIAKNMALFYIDWYGINTFEGGHTSLSPNPFLSKYLDNPAFIEKKEEAKANGVIRLYQTKSGKPEIYWDVEQYLEYFKFKDTITSPILSTTNAPAILIFTDTQGFEFFTRMLSAYNYNSKYLIPIKVEEPIDKYTLDDLKQFPAIVLYNYRYQQKNKAFKLLKSYVEQGGKIFIDTGSNSPEGESKSLSDFFPFQSTKRKILGNQWSWEKGTDPIIDDVDIDSFGPSEYEDSGWKFSLPEQDLGNASVFLKNHDEPMLATWQLGKGSVLWSGMNLPFHYVRFNVQEEGKIFINFIKQAIELKENENPLAQVEFLSPTHVRIKPSVSAKAVLFKQEFWPGWQAKDKDRKLPIFSAGPTYFGFIYIPLNSKYDSIDIKYRGTYKYAIQLGISGGLSLLLLIEFLTNGFISGVILRRFGKNLQFKLSKWWEKEE